MNSIIESYPNELQCLNRELGLELNVGMDMKNDVEIRKMHSSYHNYFQISQIKEA